MSNAVNHPKHYNELSAYCECGRQIECITVVREMNFNLGNVIKYLWRAGLKGDNAIEDLEKALWYLMDEIARLKRRRAAKQKEEQWTTQSVTKHGGKSFWGRCQKRVRYIAFLIARATTRTS